MKLTPASRQPQLSGRRRRTAALVAGLAAIALIVTAAPVALAAPAAPLAGDVAASDRPAPSSVSIEPATDAEHTDVTDTQDGEESITVDDLRQLVTQFEAEGEVTFAGARRLVFLLVFVERNIDRGTPSLAVRDLEEFKRQASNPSYVPSESARDELIAAADQLIAQLTGTL